MAGVIDDAAMLADVESAGPSDEQLRGVSALASRQVELATEVVELQQLLDVRKKELFAVETDQLPSAMEEVGLDVVGAGDYLIEIERVISGSVSNRDIERKARALAFMRAHGAGDLIKREVKAVFPATELGAAAARGLLMLLDDLPTFVAGIAATLADEDVAALRSITDVEYKVTEVESIHAAKLKTWLKEMVDSGEQLPDEDFKLFRGNVAKVSKR